MDEKATELDGLNSYFQVPNYFRQCGKTYKFVELTVSETYSRKQLMRSRSMISSRHQEEYNFAHYVSVNLHRLKNSVRYYKNCKY